MIFTATPEPEYRRIRLDFDTESADKFASIAVYRDGRPIRSQPPTAGLSQTFVYDYEPPRGRPINYMADVVYSVSDAVDFDEPWTDLSQWDETLSATVVDEKLATGEVRRALDGGVGPTFGRIDFTDRLPNMGVFTFSGLRLATNPNRIEYAPGGPGNLISTLPAITGPWSLQWSSNLITVLHSAGSFTVGFNGLRTAANPTDMAFVVSAGKSGFPAFTVFDMTAEAGTTATVTATTQLDSLEALLIHPSRPSLTVSLGDPHANDGDIWVAGGTDDDRTFEESQSVFDVAGRDEAVSFPTGERKSGQWPLLVRTETLEARNRVLNLTKDHAPILLRSPAHAGWDLPDGWYTIRAQSVKRVTDIGTAPQRLITLELKRVGEPPVTVVPPRTWGDLLFAGYTWGDLFRNGYKWLDLLAGEF